MYKKTKLISAVLSAAMLFSALPTAHIASAAGLSKVSLKGIYEPYNTISVVSDADGTKIISWKISDSKDGAYEEIQSGSQDTLFISKNYAGKWIKPIVTSNGVTVESEPRQIAALYTKRDKITSANTTYYPNGIKKSTPATSLFSVDGQEFILLDTTESDPSKFFVMSKNHIGKSTFFNTVLPLDAMCFLNSQNTLEYYKNADTKQTFTSTTDFASVNEETGATNGYKNNAAFVQLPAVVFEHIDNAHMWQVEPQMYENNSYNHQIATSIKGGISIASATELLKYYEKFGFTDFADNWWTRTPWATLTGGDGSCILITYGSKEDIASGHGGKMMTNYRTNSNAVRPVFYLNRDFFLNYPVSLEGVGADVKNAILKNYSLEELTAAGYDALELADYSGVLTSLDIKGVYDTNLPLTAVFDGPQKASVQWQIADNKDGEYSNIAGAVSKTYISNQTMGLKWIRFSATSATETVYSEPIQLQDRWYGKGKSGSGQKTNPVDSGVVYQISFNSMPEDSNPKFIFTLGGQNFILLDTMNDDNSHFLVMSQKVVGTRKLVNSSQVLTDLMCWFNDMNATQMRVKNVTTTLNSTTQYATDGGYGELSKTPGSDFIELPAEIVRNINENAVWKAEPKMWIDGNHERTYTGGITLPSATELERYEGKYGWRDAGVDNWWLRTGNGYNDGSGGESMMFYKKSDNNVQTTNGNNYEYGYRPIFYLHKDFFTDAKPAWSSMGVEVKKEISRNYTMEELISAGYSEEEIGIFYDDTDYLVENISVTGNFETTTPLTLTYHYEGPEELLMVSWQIADSEDGIFKDIAGTVGKTKFVIPVAMENQYIRVRFQLIDGKEFFSSAHLIAPKWKWQYAIVPDHITKSEAGTLIDAENNPVTVTEPTPKRIKTPAQYTFNVDGQIFALLDVAENNGNSKYLVMSVNTVGSMKYNTSGQRVEDMAAFLNNKNTVVSYYNGEQATTATADYTANGYLENSNFNQLPEGIINHIDYDHVWKIERKMYDDTAERAVTAGIMIPSVHEILEYSGKIGLYDDRIGWWTRTPNGKRGESGDGMLSTSSDYANAGRFFAQIRNGQSLGIRPIFWLKPDFFEKVKAERIGSEALKIIKENNSAAALSSLYNESKLANVFGYGAVTAEFKNLDNGKAAEAIVSVSEEAAGAELFFAVYDSANRLLSVDKATAQAGTVRMSLEAMPVAVRNAKLFAWDGLNGKMTPVAAQLMPERGRISIFLAGDSTVADYAAGNKSDDPLKSQFGWGEVLQEFFDREDVAVVNFAAGGRSAKSFINESRLSNILSVAEAGDYILVQFAHNDQWSQDPTVASDISEYKSYLAQYVQQAEAIGVNVVFVTPPVRRQYSNDVFTGGTGLGAYPQAMREVAAENHVPYIDLFAMSEEFMMSMLSSETTSYYMPNDPQHFNIYGATKMAEFVTSKMAEDNHPLCIYLK